MKIRLINDDNLQRHIKMLRLHSKLVPLGLLLSFFKKKT